MKAPIDSDFESWRRVWPDDDKYWASTIGRIWNANRGQARPGTVNCYGYRQVHIGRAGRTRRFRVHRLVAMAFHSREEHQYVVRHLDGDPLNNCADNLAWGTQKDNMADATRHGTGPGARTHCPRQHRLAPPNLGQAHARRGDRACLACKKAHKAKWDAKNRGEVWSELIFAARADMYYDKIMKATRANAAATGGGTEGTA